MKEAVRYLEQYADEVEDEGLHTLADDIRECAVSLKDVARMSESDVPRTPSGIPDEIDYKDERWIRKDRSARRIGDLTKRINDMTKRADDLERRLADAKRQQRVQFVPLDTRWVDHYDPRDFTRIQDLRVRLRTSEEGYLAADPAEVFEALVYRLRDEFLKLKPSPKKETATERALDKYDSPDPYVYRADYSDYF